MLFWGLFLYESKGAIPLDNTEMKLG